MSYPLYPRRSGTFPAPKARGIPSRSHTCQHEPKKRQTPMDGVYSYSNRCPKSDRHGQ
ncbi:hypothetical protein RSAG8_09627, partial [Rhizoctonia solani AG-8 WAC10335]